MKALRSTGSTPMMSDRVEYMEESIGVFKDAAQQLQSSCMVTRYETAQALEHNSSVQEDVHGPLLAGLVANDESRLVRHAAARALGTLGQAVSPHASVLARALQDSEPLVRRDAVRALAGASPKALQPHARALGAALEDDFWPVRLWACKALIACGPPAAAVPHLARKLAHLAVGDPEDGVQDAAAKVLATFGNGAVEHIRWIVEKLLSPKEDDHVSASWALASLLGAPGGEACKIVTEALQPVIFNAEDHGHGSSHAASRKAIAALEGALQDEDWQTRLRGVEELRNLALR